MITTRFAPSPTGHIHIGNLRTALFNYLVTKNAGGKFILRIDDTDQSRSKQEYIDGIQRDLEWLGIGWDVMEQQSKRLDLYEAAAENLRSQGRFYECFESPSELDLKRKKQLNMGRPPVYDRSSLHLSDAEKDARRNENAGYWRFLLNHERIEWLDGVLGNQSIDAASVSDPVLIRADGQMLYTLASVVDDLDMGVTNVVRGSDHVTNTATQIQIIEALGGQAPQFAHHSLLTGPQGEALSKRLGSLSIKDFREAGAEPMAIVSMMASLGSSKPLELAKDIDELAGQFDLSNFGAAPTKFDPEDVTRLSTSWLRSAELAAIESDLDFVPAAFQADFWAMASENVEKRSEIQNLWELVSGDVAPIIEEADQEFVESAMALLPKSPWDGQTWKNWTEAVKSSSGRKGKALFLPLRKAIMGRAYGPDMGKFMALRDKVISNN